MTQAKLFDAVLEHATMPPLAVNYSVDPRERKRLSKQCALILARLQQGPATNRELSALSLKYTSRISDLRAAGYEVRVSSRNYETGETLYQLTEESDGRSGARS